MYHAASHRPVGSEGETPGWQTLASSEHVPAVLVAASLHTACRRREEERKEEEGGKRKREKKEGREEEENTTVIQMICC